MIHCDALRNILNQHGLTRFWWSNDQATLTFTNRRNQFDRTCSNVFTTTVTHLKIKLFIGEQRREVFKQHLVLGIFWCVVVDLVNFQQSKVALVIFWRTNLTDDRVTGT